MRCILAPLVRWPNLVCHYNDYSRHRLLRTLIFDAESCSFMQLRKMLSLIFDLFQDQISILTKDESKKLRRQLNDIIIFRNMFAHGDICINAPTSEVLIQYFQGGQVETVISEGLINDFVEKCKEVDICLRKLNEYFRNSRIEYPSSN